MKDFRTLTEIAKAARENLSDGDWDYLIGGADTETSLRRNRAAVESWVFKPRVLNNVSQVTTASTLLGTPMRMPVLLPPIGSIQVFSSGGGVDVAAAAAEFGILQILSSACEPDFEAVAQAVPGPRIYQLYLTGDQAWMDDNIKRALDAGYTGLCLTADTQVYSRRERDILKRYVPLSGRTATTGTSFNYQASMNWDTVAHIKQNFDIELMIKGVMTSEDAVSCVEAGVDVVYISNHGGRQLDHTRACIDSLPEVSAAVAGRVPVVVDGGFMRGADVVKALCLGADFVGMGRLEGLAMAAGGKEAVRCALDIVEQEIQISMALLGAPGLEHLGPHLLERQQPLSDSHALSAFPLLAEGY
ncbi:MAG: alpha-hydroxy-acid oxidizing protein [OM182 bacterium]|nr:MAG: alpha-hydroxy-acid oxidizing protein [OM182 bacterium]|tara:strand:- start:28827 stop:29903 length:1077 start_codon:yes stop_codon:yes gene_type:complete